MAADFISLSAPQTIVNERSSLVVTARFRNRAAAADVTPTNIYYRLDDGEIGEITGWTSVTPGTTATISLSSTQNQIRNCTRALEQKVLSVASDYGLSTQYIQTLRYDVRNQPYYS